jgi:hypothetical protein
MTTLIAPEPRTAHAPAGRLIEQFMPLADIAEYHETVVHAPAELVLDVAGDADLQSLPLVRAVFRLRELLLGSMQQAKRTPRGLIAETQALGWGTLAERPGRELVMGAVTRPWEADVTFRTIPAEEFAAFCEPGMVKIVWTLEVVPIEPALTLFRTETRGRATDAAARRRMGRYWLLVGGGVALIRWLMLRGVRREAERRYRKALRF